MNIGIIGYGVVGKVTSLTFKKSYNVVKYDKFQNLDPFQSLINTEFTFIMVPTPFDCNLTSRPLAVKESLLRLDEINYKGIVIIKSTIPPGSCDIFHF